MNKRIRELVKQAVVAVDIVTGNEALDDELAKMYIPDCFAEKFAELIVKECTKAIDPTGDLTSMAEEGWRRSCMKMIEEHFGVEE